MNTISNEYYDALEAKPVYDSDVDRMLEKGALAIDKTKTLSFAVTSDNMFRITINEKVKGKNAGVETELFIDMPKEDLIALSKEFPKFVEIMNG